jgi:hypothetical protein
MIRRVIQASACLLLIAALPTRAENVTTWRYDITRQGQNTNETQLTPETVNPTQFGKLYSYAVDGFVYAQPLYVGLLNFAGVTHNVVYVATEHDSVFAFDADRNQLLWKASLFDTAHGATMGATTVPSSDVGTNDIVPEIGVTGTPVIDAAAGTLYVVSKTKESGLYVSRLHALDLVTGGEKSGSPVTIQGAVPGSGIGSVGGMVAFQAQWQLNRTGLLLFNGHVYVVFSAHGDNGPYHGWIFSYDAATLKQTAIFNSSPNGKGNGIWHSGAALAADTVNGVPRIFFATGNFFSTKTGAENPTPPYTSAQNYSCAIVSVDVTNGGLKVADEWTPFDEQHLSDSDIDQTSGGILLLPDQPGANVHELVQVGKNGRIEVLDRDNLGGFNTTYNDIAQELSAKINGLWSTPAYWNGNVYFWGSVDRLKQFTLADGKLSAAAKAIGSVTSNFPGASPVITSNGTSDGILWAIRSDGYNSGGPAILYAFDATNVATQLYNSTQNAARDTAGKATKFVVPMVNAGRVYVGTEGEVDVYGSLAAATPTAATPVLSPAPGVYASAQTVSIADAAAGATIYYTTDSTPPTTGSARYAGPFNVSATATIQALAVAAGYNTSGVASGVYTIGVAPSIDFSDGFASAKGLTLNGSAVNSDDSRLQLTTGGANQAGSAFANTPVNIQSFVSDFTLQLSGTLPLADGITFTLQTNGPTALGPPGGGLGYGPQQLNGTGGIPHSVAVKFDVYNNNGEGNDSTGVYVNGASPTTPAVSLAPSHIVLSSGDTMTAHLAYDGAFLYLTLKDPVNGYTYSGRSAIDIVKTLGATSAYVGFTGGTGGYIASQKILTWIFTSQPIFAVTQFQAQALPAVSSGPTFRTFAWGGFPDGTGTILDATKVGDSVIFTGNFTKAGTYDLHVTGKNWNVRGEWQLSLDGVDVGAVQDEYTATDTLGNFDVGPIVIGSPGNHTLKFTVAGRNAASTSYAISFDVLRFDQR